MLGAAAAAAAEEEAVLVTPDHLAAQLSSSHKLPLSPLLKRLATLGTSTYLNAHQSHEWLSKVCRNGLPISAFHKPTEESTQRLNSLLNRLLAFHAPWLASVMANFDINIAQTVFYPLLDPWEANLQISDADALNFLQWLVKVSQSCAAAILCISILLGNAGALLAICDRDSLLKYLTETLTKLYTDHNYLDGTWSLASDTAAATPQTFAEEWDAEMTAFENSPPDEAGAESLLHTKLPQSCIMSVAPTELIDILFRRATIREFLKLVGENNTFTEAVPTSKNPLMRLGPLATKAQFLDCVRLGINLGLAQHQISVIEEARETLISGDLFMVDCYTMEPGGGGSTTPLSPPTSRKLRNSLAVGQAVLYDTEDRAAERDTAQCEFLDCLAEVRGRTIGFVTREAWVKADSPVGLLLQKCKDRAFPRLFAVTGGWAALKLEILQLPKQYHDQLLVPAHSRPAWPLDSFGYITNTLRGIGEDGTSATHLKENVKAFIDRESEQIANATQTFRKRMWKLFGTTEEPSSGPTGRSATVPVVSGDRPTGPLQRFETADEESTPTAGAIGSDRPTKILSAAAVAVGNWWGNMTSSVGSSSGAVMSPPDTLETSGSAPPPPPPTTTEATGGDEEPQAQFGPRASSAALPSQSSPLPGDADGKQVDLGSKYVGTMHLRPTQVELDIEDSASGEDIDLNADDSDHDVNVTQHGHAVPLAKRRSDRLPNELPSIVQFEASGTISPPMSVVGEPPMLVPHTTAVTGERTQATAMTDLSVIATESAPAGTLEGGYSLGRDSETLPAGDDVSLDDELAALEKDLDQQADARFKALAANKC